VFFFGKLGFPFLIMMFWLYSYSLRLEQEHFSRRTADYIYALLFVWVVMLGVAFLFDLMVSVAE
jgi:derlin-1